MGGANELTHNKAKQRVLHVIKDIHLISRPKLFPEKLTCEI